MNNEKTIVNQINTQKNNLRVAIEKTYHLLILLSNKSYDTTCEEEKENCMSDTLDINDKLIDILNTNLDELSKIIGC